MASSTTLPLFVATGNKSDLQTQRQVFFEDACVLAENNGLLAVLETSAKEAQNVDAAFTLMARELLARNGMNIMDAGHRDSPQLMLSNSSHSIQGAMTSDKKCGCWSSLDLKKLWRQPEVFERLFYSLTLGETVLVWMYTVFWLLFIHILQSVTGFKCL